VLCLTWTTSLISATLLDVSNFFSSFSLNSIIAIWIRFVQVFFDWNNFSLFDFPQACWVPTCLLVTVVLEVITLFTFAVLMNMELLLKLKLWKKIVHPKKFVTSIISFLSYLFKFFLFNKVHMFMVAYCISYKLFL
jgi:hypothetical protein